MSGKRHLDQVRQLLNGGSIGVRQRESKE